MEVYGASSLRTTVKDLLVWRRHLSSSPPDLAIDGLYWSPDNDSVLELYRDVEGLARRNSPGRFRLGSDGLYRLGAERWGYVPAAAGQPPRLLALYDPLPPRTYELVTNPAPTNAPVLDLAGAYWSEELATTYQVALDDGALTISWPRNAPIHLSPAGADRYFSPSLGTVTFRLDAAGQAISLTLSLRRAWRIEATRAALAAD